MDRVRNAVTAPAGRGTASTGRARRGGPIPAPSAAQAERAAEAPSPAPSVAKAPPPAPSAAPARPAPQARDAHAKRQLADEPRSSGPLTRSFETADAPAPSEPVGRDRFAGASENGFRTVRDAPVSTFSLDVDTASYAFVRASLNRNVLPQPAAVRTEELVNYFPYACSGLGAPVVAPLIGKSVQQHAAERMVAAGLAIPRPAMSRSGAVPSCSVAPVRGKAEHKMPAGSLPS